MIKLVNLTFGEVVKGKSLKKSEISIDKDELKELEDTMYKICKKVFRTISKKKMRKIIREEIRKLKREHSLTVKIVSKSIEKIITILKEISIDATLEFNIVDMYVISVYDELVLEILLAYVEIEDRD